MNTFDIENEDEVPFSERFVWDLQAVRHLGQWLYESVPRRHDSPFFSFLREAYLRMPDDESILESIDAIHAERRAVSGDEE